MYFFLLPLSVHLKAKRVSVAFLLFSVGKFSLITHQRMMSLNFEIFSLVSGSLSFRQIRGHAEQMGLHFASCGDDLLQLRRCLAASFFLNAALRQPEGIYRYLSAFLLI